MTNELTTDEVKEIAEACGADYTFRLNGDSPFASNRTFDPINNNADSHKMFTALHEICRPLNISISIFQGALEVTDENGKHITKRLRCSSYSIARALLAVLNIE